MAKHPSRVSRAKDPNSRSPFPSPAPFRDDLVASGMLKHRGKLACDAQERIPWGFLSCAPSLNEGKAAVGPAARGQMPSTAGRHTRRK